MNWGRLIIGDEVTAVWLGETQNLKR